MIKMDTSIWGWLKTIGYGIACVYSWLDTTGINAYVFTTLLVCMILDMILGVQKAKVVNALESPTSKKAKKGIISKAIMFVIPAVVGLVWGIFDKENALRVVNTLLTALAIAEAYSNVANAYIIYTGELLSEFDAVSYVIKKSARKIKALLEKFLE